MTAERTEFSFAITATSISYDAPVIPVKEILMTAERSAPY